MSRSFNATRAVQTPAHRPALLAVVVIKAVSFVVNVKSEWSENPGLDMPQKQGGNGCLDVPDEVNHQPAVSEASEGRAERRHAKPSGTRLVAPTTLSPHIIETMFAVYCHHAGWDCESRRLLSNHQTYLPEVGGHAFTTAASRHPILLLHPLIKGRTTWKPRKERCP